MRDGEVGKSDAEGAAGTRKLWPGFASSSSAPADDLSGATVPVTVITGFLGAGKTTLLRHVLSEPHGLKIAVIQNELSATAGLEASTVRGPNGECFDDWVELANGCVCCAVRDDLVVAIERLMEVKGRFDYVLVETTGMADPGPVAATFWVDDALESPLRLDGIVAVADAQHLHRQLHTLECCRQVASADAVLLNKTDAADAAQLAAARAHLRHLNALAPIHETARSAVRLHEIMHLQAYTADRARALQPQLWPPPARRSGARSGGGGGGGGGGENCEPCDEDGSSDGGCHGSGGGGGGPPMALRWLHRDADFGAVTLVDDGGALDLARVHRFFARVFWEAAEAGATSVHGAGGGSTTPGATAPAIVFRAKGLLHIAGSERAHALQAVHETYELVEAHAWPDGDERLNRLVFIGHGLREGELRAALAACRAA